MPHTKKMGKRPSITDPLGEGTLKWCVVLKNAATQTQGIFRKHICFWTETIGFTCEYGLIDTKTKKTLKNRRKKKQNSDIKQVYNDTCVQVWY